MKLILKIKEYPAFFRKTAVNITANLCVKPLYGIYARRNDSKTSLKSINFAGSFLKGVPGFDSVDL